MAETITVRCEATDCRYYKDAIRVHCGDINLLVPIHAYPVAALRTLPKRVDFGSVWLSNTARRVLPLRSTLPLELEYEITVLEYHPDFIVEPLRGVIPAEGEALVELLFTPTRLAIGRIELEVR